MKTVLDVVIDEIEKDLTARREALCRGQPADFAQYQHLCGHIRGLELAQDYAKGLLQRMKDDQDE